jgi:protoheme IX farnesyltransferase
MKLAETSTAALTLRPMPAAPAAALAGSRWADSMALAKPRISLMVLLTVAVGFLVASAGQPDVMLLVHALLGVAFVATAANVLNQYLERDTDALMRRTQNRPLPAGRLAAAGALWSGVVLAVVGLVYLVLAVNSLAALLTGLTLAGYVLAYTPLKRKTAWNTFVGAIPGALPPVIGYAAAAGEAPATAWALFAILFCWQFPHFWAIAWLYREEYAAAGLRMLPNIDTEGGRLTGRLMVKTGVLLILASLLPALWRQAGPGYFVGALLLGLWFLLPVLRFLWKPCRAHAKQTLWASLVYLPMVYTLLLLDGTYRLFDW